MWMGDEQRTLDKAGGMETLSGKIVSRVDQRQPRSAGFFSSPEPDVWLFRVQDRASGRVASVRFEGPINGMLDQGDFVTVQGFVQGGVLNARKITDEHGAVLAQSKCFVATAVFGDPMAPEVETLHRFREQVLNTSAAGRWLVAIYWRVGPRAARWMERHDWGRTTVRAILLRPLCKALRCGMTRASILACTPRRHVANPGNGSAAIPSVHPASACRRRCARSLGAREMEKCNVSST
jgi:hypothetical protein